MWRKKRKKECGPRLRSAEIRIENNERSALAACREHAVATKRPLLFDRPYLAFTAAGFEECPGANCGTLATNVAEYAVFS